MKYLTLGLVLIMSISTASADTYNGYETPSFTLLKDYGEIEVRAYGPVTEAKISKSGGRSSAAGSGFRALAGYIFGDNAGEQKINMTAPVVQEPLNDTWKISFILPSSVTPETAPKPINDDVEITTRPASKLAVIRFSGLWTETRLSQYEQKLRAEMAAKGLRPEGSPIYMFYNDPMTLPWNRRNEIALRIQGS